MRQPTGPEPADPGQAEVLLVHGVSWPGREPHLALADVASGAGRLLPLHRRRLGYRAAGDGLHCTGWYDAGRARSHPCPEGQRAAAGGRCPDCALRDQFRFVHHGHTGGYLPAGLERVLGAPHRLYLATFADGVTKVGTATAARTTERIDEQAAVLATWVARAADGRVVREAEDLVTAELEVPQHRGRAAKVAALARPAPREAVTARHHETVAQVVALLDRAGLGTGLRPTEEHWEPPPAAGPLADPPPQGRWAGYPHDLRTGVHGLHVEACSGPAALARAGSATDAAPYLVDLGRLRGARIVLGPFSSPDSEVQDPLF